MIKVEAIWQGKMKFIGYDEQGHQAVFDSGLTGELTAGPTPMQIFLQALAICSGMDMVSILEKRKLKLEHFRIEVEGERTDTFPKIYTDIRVKYIASGEGISLKELKRAVNLSVDKYCSILGMIDRAKTGVEIDYQVEN